MAFDFVQSMAYETASRWSPAIVWPSHSGHSAHDSPLYGVRTPRCATLDHLVKHRLDLRWAMLPWKWKTPPVLKPSGDASDRVFVFDVC